MRAARSPSTGRRYPLTMISPVFRVARSRVYAATAPAAPPAASGKHGPKTRVSDAEVLAAIRAVLEPLPRRRLPQGPGAAGSSGRRR
jgi:hypothetical protein